MVGIASLVWLAPYPSPAARRVALLAGAASWSLAIAGAFSATVLYQLVSNLPPTGYARSL